MMLADKLHVPVQDIRAVESGKLPSCSKHLFTILDFNEIREHPVSLELMDMMREAA